MEYFDNNTGYLNQNINNSTHSEALEQSKDLQRDPIEIPDYGESKARSEKIAHINVEK